MSWPLGYDIPAAGKVHNSNVAGKVHNSKWLIDEEPAKKSSLHFELINALLDHHDIRIDVI